MTAEQFTMWLHGYLEISGATKLEEKELQVVKDHLEKFFVKVTPDRVVTYTPPGTTMLDPLKDCTCLSVTNLSCPIHGIRTTILC